MMQGIPAQARNPSPADLIELAKNPDKYEAIEKKLRELTREAETALAKLSIGEATQQALDAAREAQAAAAKEAADIKAQAETDAAKIIQDAEAKAEQREADVVNAQTEIDAQRAEFDTRRRAVEKANADRSRALEVREAKQAEEAAEAEVNLEKSRRMIAAANASINDLQAIATRISEAAK